MMFILEKNNRDSSLAWLKNGVWALALAGLYSIVLVALRTPGLSNLFDDKSLFKSSLIIHVDLSVLVWLLSIAAVVWSYGSREVYFEKIFNKLAFAGMLLMAVSPLIGSSNPVMNNYVPILENVWFIIGLSLFGTSLLCFAILVFISQIATSLRGGVADVAIPGDKTDALLTPVGIASPIAGARNDVFLSHILPIVKITSSLMYIGVWICFALSFKQLDYIAGIVPMDLEYYYELLFWSGGHLMQFIYTQIVMFVWLVLAGLWKGQSLRYYKIYACVFGLNFLVSMSIFYGHMVYQMPDYEFIAFFTTHMKHGGGLAPVLFILVLLVSLCGGKSHATSLRAIEDGVAIPGGYHDYSRPAEIATATAWPRNDGKGYIPTALFTSKFLFFVGGLIGILISGVNVSIPAHYHGSIVGISIAFLGFAYVFCFEDAKASKWPTVQLYLITIGQLLHISGLALSGGYGILRKNPDDIIPTSAKIYMGMMGGGGLIAIIGGLMFVYICGKKLYRS